MDLTLLVLLVADEPELDRWYERTARETRENTDPALLKAPLIPSALDDVVLLLLDVLLLLVIPLLKDFDMVFDIPDIA